MKLLINQVYDVMNKNIKKIFDIEIEVNDIKNATRPEFGAYQSNFAMTNSKKIGKNPREIAEILIKNFDGEKIIEKIEVAGPGFINIYLTNEIINEDIKKIEEENYDYEIDNSKKVVIDYSSPNIAKRMHVGHLRSTIIGDSLKKIYEELGFEVLGDNHIGDWGTQFGKLIVAYNLWLDKEKYEKNPIEELERLYVLFGEKAKDDPKLEDLAREELKKVQQGDEKNNSLWKEFIEISLKEYDKVYDRLGIKFELINGESFYNDMMKPLLDILVEKNIAKEDDGALVVFFDKLPPSIVRKKDGSFLYSTSDLATIKYRKDELKTDIALYVVDERQDGHFKQVFEISNMLGEPYNYEKHFVGFGIMRFGDGMVFSSRKGNTIRLIELLDQAKEEVKKLVENKNPELSKEEIEELSEKIGVASIKYFDLSQNRISPITFTWDKVLNFEGNTGPYLQYAYVRIMSILRKAKEQGYVVENINVLSNNSTEIEKELAIDILKYPQAVIKAYETLRPNIIADYVYDLVKKYNTFYNSIKILSGDKELIENRLVLIEKVSFVIKKSLMLLGISTVDKM